MDSLKATTRNPRIIIGLILGALICASNALPAEAGAERLIITTASGERFIGVLASEDSENVRLVSATLGEISIRRSSISTLTRGNGGQPASPAPVPAPVLPAEAPAPKQGIIQSRLNLPGKFDASVGFGLLAQSGIFEQATLSGSFDVGWEVGAYSLKSSVMARHQTTHGRVIDDALDWDTTVQRNLSPKRFLLGAVYYREDTVMAVDQEWVLFLGPGFNFVKTPVMQVVTVVGPAYIWQHYLSPGGNLPAPAPLGDLAVAFSQSFSYNLQPRLQVAVSALVAQSVEDRTKRLASLMLSLNFSFSDILSLSNSYSWQQDSLPRFGTEKHQGVLSTQLKLKL